MNRKFLGNAYSADEGTVRRWMVNYIRHNLSDYDEELEELWNRTGKFKGYIHYKIKLAEEMKKIYPELAKEIDMYMLGIKEVSDENKKDEEENN